MHYALCIGLKVPKRAAVVVGDGSGRQVAVVIAAVEVLCGLDLLVAAAQVAFGLGFGDEVLNV